MSDRSYKRLTAYALISVMQLVIGCLLAIAHVDSGTAGLVLLAVMLPVFWVWGLFQADLAMNPYLDHAERARWRIAFACVPGSAALYWHRHVRLRRLAD